jgi:hypothetical protein
MAVDLRNELDPKLKVYLKTDTDRRIVEASRQS